MSEKINFKGDAVDGCLNVISDGLVYLAIILVVISILIIAQIIQIINEIQDSIPDKLEIDESLTPESTSEDV